MYLKVLKIFTEYKVYRIGLPEEVLCISKYVCVNDSCEYMTHHRPQQPAVGV